MSNEKFEEFLKSIDVEKLYDWMHKDDLHMKLANLKLDQILKLYFLAMEGDGKNAIKALEYLKVYRGYQNKKFGSNELLDLLISRGEDVLKLFDDLQYPEKRMNAAKLLRERNLI
jgi:hypothetical protein